MKKFKKFVRIFLLCVVSTVILIAEIIIMTLASYNFFTGMSNEEGMLKALLSIYAIGFSLMLILIGIIIIGASSNVETNDEKTIKK